MSRWTLNHLLTNSWTILNVSWNTQAIIVTSILIDLALRKTISIDFLISYSAHTNIAIPLLKVGTNRNTGIRTNTIVLTKRTDYFHTCSCVTSLISSSANTLSIESNLIYFTFCNTISKIQLIGILAHTLPSIVILVVLANSNTSLCCCGPLESRLAGNTNTLIINLVMVGLTNTLTI